MLAAHLRHIESDGCRVAGARHWRRVRHTFEVYEACAEAPAAFAGLIIFFASVTFVVGKPLISACLRLWPHPWRNGHATLARHTARPDRSWLKKADSQALAAASFLSVEAPYALDGIFAASSVAARLV